VYFGCVIWPPLALAFADGAVVAHCLTDDHHGSATTHVHEHGAGDVHHARTDANDAVQQPTHPHDRSAPDNCCGLFSPNAMTPGASIQIASSPRGTVMRPALEAALAGHQPNRLDRPPNVPSL
jgi:hypothetical protein